MLQKLSKCFYLCLATSYLTTSFIVVILAPSMISLPITVAPLSNIVSFIVFWHSRISLSISLMSVKQPLKSPWAISTRRSIDSLLPLLTTSLTTTSQIILNWMQLPVGPNLVIRPLVISFPKFINLTCGGFANLKPPNFELLKIRWWSSLINLPFCKNY